MPAPPPACGPDRSYRMTQVLVSRWHTCPKDTVDRSLRAALPPWLPTPHHQYGPSQTFRLPHAYHVISHLLLHLVPTPCSKRSQGSILDAALRGDQAQLPLIQRL